MIITFWIILGIIIYIYIGYPLLLWILSFLKRDKQPSKGEFEPTVSFIITAYNEEKVIEEKLKNTLTLDYPRQKREIIIVNDCSTDRTEEIVKKYINKGIKLINSGKRVGKTGCQNIAVKQASGEILVFSDATSHYNRNTIKMLVKNFSDSSVGCVGGKLKYIAKGTAAESESIYLKYESYLKSLESKLCSLVGVDGSIYSVRKDAFVNLKENLISDFIEPIMIYRNGLKTIYEKNAISLETVSEKIKGSITRRIRIITRALFGLLSVKYMLNPFRYRFFSLELISHKLLRWFQPFFFIALFISNIFLLHKLPFFIFFLLQVALYIFGTLGLIFRKITILKLPAYFISMNYAFILSWINLVRRKNFVLWETSR
jgi:cellulose synthase/poly-beta-1,6-N-acetylglucosamine synthase-like glycosyltransferase